MNNFLRIPQKQLTCFSFFQFAAFFSWVIVLKVWFFDYFGIQKFAKAITIMVQQWGKGSLTRLKTFLFSLKIVLYKFNFQKTLKFVSTCIL